MRKQSRSLRANKKTGPELTQHFVSLAGTMDGESFREEVFNGTDYVVVPVVALVEGVLQGMNAPVPEFAPAAAFAKFPEGWNGRPLVMNHPTNADGTPISANSTAAMESNGFGLIFNTKIEDGKLKTEAWIDVAKATEKGGEFLSTLERVKANEMVEVSTGCFVTTMQKKGMFNGRSYEAVWIEVVPDHLALLSEGVKGACSIEDGCGTPRSNKEIADMTKKTKRKPMKGRPKNAPKMPAKADDDEEDVKNQAEATEAHEAHSNCGCGGSGAATCTCADKGKPAVQKLNASSASISAEERTRLTEEAELRAEVLHSYFDAHAVPDNLLSDDIQRVISRALKDFHAGADVSCFLIGWTTNVAVYEKIDWSVPSGSWDIFQIPMNVTSDGVVTFTGDPQEVNLLTRIVSVNEGMENAMPKANADAAGTTPTPAGDDKDKKNGNEPASTSAAPNEPTTPTTPTTPTPPVQEPPTEPTNNAAKKPEAPKVLSAQQYIDQAPPEVRQALQESMRVHDEKKAAIVKALMDTKRCAFSEAELKDMTIPALEKLMKLADVPTYEGISLPGRTEHLSRQNAGGDDNPWAAPPAPSVYAAATASSTETKQ